MNKRTTIVTDTELYVEAQALARRERASLSQIVREALTAYITSKTSEKKRLSFVGIGLGPKNKAVSRKAKDIAKNRLNKKTGWL
ncbi:MAG: ribbon-helix-helix protein, CopG family [Elusimicrobia bacterium]|nr:ribbon-helix-helix protein, CopG family [Elusimicrobiota bacterium]